MEDATMQAIIMAVVGLLVAVVGVLGRARKLPANAMIGIRLPATTVSDEAWGETHVAAGPWLVLAGVVPFAMSMFLLAIGTKMPEWTSLLAYGAMVIFVLVGAVRGVRAAHALTSTT